MQKYYSNCDDQQGSDNTIVIKSEPAFNIKVENDEDQLEIRRQVTIGIDQRKTNALDKLKIENNKLVQDVLCIKADYDRVCDLLNKKEAECSDLHTKLSVSEQTVSDQNSQIRRLQMKQKKTFPKCLKETYNVDKIVSHKMVQGKLNFLVRWENFSAADDTWEPKENLLCKKI